MARKPTLLLDADVLCHQFAYLNTDAFSFDGETTLESLRPEKAKVDCESYILKLAENLKAGDVVIVLSDRNANFRKELEPTYKSKRKPKPTLWYELREFLETRQLSFEMVCYPRLEGDDTLGILATGEFKDRSIIVSIDKDMKTIPGRLYDPHPVRADDGVKTITEIDAMRFHAYQTLAGDSVDGYGGLRMCGPQKAEAILAGATTPEDIWTRVFEAYEKKKVSLDHAILQARLAFILHDGYYNKDTNRITLWKPPI